MHKGHIAKPFGVALDGRLLEGLQVRLGLHHLGVMLTLGALVKDGESNRALKRPGQLWIESSLHGVYKEGDVVGASRSVGRLQVQAKAQFVAWATRVEPWAVLNHWLARLLVPEVAREAPETPNEDAVALLGLHLPKHFLKYKHLSLELCNLTCLCFL